MKIVIAPDKFKGTLTAQEVCDIIAAAIHERDSSVEIVKIPMADGGEGSLDVLSVNLDVEEVRMYVKDPLFRNATAMYLRKGDVAFIEMAQASGLQLIKESQRNPLFTTTYGTGQMIKHAVKNGCNSVYLFVGGSATNDGGMGMLQALGYQFLDKNEEDLFGVGESMNQVDRIVAPSNPLTFSMKVVCDVENPFFGKNGAAFVYGPQKGADEATVKELDEGLQNLATRFKVDLDKDIADIQGSGAAGGIAGGAMVGLGADLVSGIDTIMTLVSFQEQIDHADLIITGEGKIDEQTLQGKLIKGISDAASLSGIPCIAFCGVNDLTADEKQAFNLKQVISLVNEETSSELAMSNAAIVLRDRALEWVSSF